MFQLSYPYMTTEKTIALTIWKFVHFTLLPYLPWPLIYKGNTSRSWEDGYFDVLDCHLVGQLDHLLKSLPCLSPSHLWFIGLLCICKVSLDLLTLLYTEENVIVSSNIFSSVQFSCSVVSKTLQPHELQHASPPCPSPTPGVHPNPCPSSWWCHQPSRPLSSPSPPAFNPSQQQSLFQWVNSSHDVAKVPYKAQIYLKTQFLF